jgi:hypothetical protein
MEIAWRQAYANDRAPAQWWRVYGAGASKLMQFAVAVLSQFVTAGACERGWKRFKFVKSKVRNRLSHSKAEKSLMVAVNKRLSLPLDEHDPGYAYSVWSSADEQLDSHLLSAAAEARDQAAEAAKPPFNCWLEQWEIDARKPGQVNEFKMQEKLVDIFFYDAEPEEGEEASYYKVHSIFWPKGARGSARVWNADCTRVQQNGEPFPTPTTGGVADDTAVYVVNEMFYLMVKQAWPLNKDRYRLVEEDVDGGSL